MILAVMVLFVIIELPQGVLNLLVAAFDETRHFTKSIYNNLADLFEMLTVLYSCVNFLLFAFMNGQFRKELIHNICTCLRVFGVKIAYSSDNHHQARRPSSKVVNVTAVVSSAKDTENNLQSSNGRQVSKNMGEVK
ncbi:unnamed protein product [Sphagnum balticum]